LVGTGLVAIFLAAGKSKRMGMNKLSLPLGTQTIGNSSLQAALASTLDHIIVVTRENDPLDWMEQAFLFSPRKDVWTHVQCVEAEKGQAYSLHAGIVAAMPMEPKGILVLLADQPFLSVLTINQMIEKFLKLSEMKKSVQFVAARFEGVPRPPVIFSPGVFPELLQLKGDEGARKILLTLEGVFVDYFNEQEFIDVDTLADYERVKGGTEKDD